MDIDTFEIKDKSGDIRQVCVIEGQPYYQSSGQNSGNKGIWYPFYGIDFFKESNSTQFVKPEVGSDHRAQIEDYFPEAICDALLDAGMGKYDQWGRFGGMEGLYMSCLLTEDFPQALRIAVAKELGLKEIKPQFALYTKPSTEPIQLLSTKDDASTINAKLVSLGAKSTTLPNLDYDPLTSERFSESAYNDEIDPQKISSDFLKMISDEEKVAPYRSLIRAVNFYKVKYFSNPDDFKKNQILNTALSYLEGPTPNIDQFMEHIENNKEILGERDFKGISDLIAAFIHTITAGAFFKTPGQKLKESLQKLKQEGEQNTTVSAQEVSSAQRNGPD